MSISRIQAATIALKDLCGKHDHKLLEIVKSLEQSAQNIIKAADKVVQSADDSGCTDNLTVVDASAVEQLATITAGQRS